ncbi:TPA: hypothetical protein JAN03_23665 [Citrobacter freundii]|nr:hypothetical protein [Citrobacter freundii]
MERFIIIFSVFLILLLGLEVVGNRPHIIRGEHGQITGVKNLSYHPSACMDNTAVMSVDGIQYSADGHYISLVHFTDLKENKYPVIASFYRLKDMDISDVNSIVQIGRVFRVTYINCNNTTFFLSSLLVIS